MEEDRSSKERDQNFPEITITVLDALECELSTIDAQIIKPTLTFKKVWWQKGRFSMKEQEYDSYKFTFKGKDVWRFHTGLLPRVKRWCEENQIKCNVIAPDLPEPLYEETSAAGNFTLRDDQLTLIRKITCHKRGIIKAPTGSGKTVLQMGIIDWYYDANILLLAHTAGIISQTAKKIQDHGINVQQIGAGEPIPPNFLPNHIVIATRQSFVKMKVEPDYFDIVLVDEAHHAVKENSQYAGILKNLLAPIRIGFTATPPEDPAEILTYEGLLGPIIGELTIQRAVELGILAKPKVKLIKLGLDKSVKRLKNWADVYESGIVENAEQNDKTIEIVNEYAKRGETSLIFVVKRVHSEYLYRIAQNFPHTKDKTHIVRGGVDYNLREEIRTLFNKKKVLCVISTVAWKEGIDVPSLDCVINAGGGKDDTGTKQLIGRGLRKTDEKEEVVIYDFFNPSHRYLIEHFGFRVSLYMENNWL